MKTFTLNNRIYEIEKVIGSNEMPYLSRDLKERGWDGNLYYASSYPTGRQRKYFTGVFYKSVKTGEFVSAT